jgi:chromosome partitioning protein
MRIIVIANLKGGCAKTTTVVNLACGLAELNKKILVLDIDPQGNASNWLNVTSPSKGAYKLLTSIDDPASLVSKTSIEGIDILDASVELSQVEKFLAGELSIETKLKRRLTTLFKKQHWDFVLIDTPPTLGILTINAFSAATEVLVPVTTHVMSLSGVTQLISTLNQVNEFLNPDLVISGFIPSRVDLRTKHSREVLEKLRETFGSKVFKTIIRENVLLAEAPSFKKSILSYRSNSNAADDYRNLTKEILNI